MITGVGVRNRHFSDKHFNIIKSYKLLFLGQLLALLFSNQNYVRISCFDDHQLMLILFNRSSNTKVYVITFILMRFLYFFELISLFSEIFSHYMQLLK